MKRRLGATYSIEEKENFIARICKKTLPSYQIFNIGTSMYLYCICDCVRLTSLTQENIDSHKNKIKASITHILFSQYFTDAS